MSRLSQAAFRTVLDSLDAARAAWLEACAAHGLDPIEQENAMLSIGREFLPECAQRALKTSKRNLPAGVLTDLYRWFLSQLYVEDSTP